MNQIQRQTEQVRVHRRFDRVAPAAGELLSFGSMQCFKFVSGYDDHVIGHLWDGDNEDTEDVLIALDPQLRKSLVGTGFTYSTFQARTEDGSGDAQAMFPEFTAGGLMFAMNVPYTGVVVDDVDLVWLLVVPSVHWTKTC